MGFLDSLKEIGFGNTGRAGRMDSGVTNFAQYQQEREGVEGKRGVSQALALAAEGGKPVSFQQMSEIAEKWAPWGVTMNDIMGAAKPMNMKLEGDQIKKEAAALMGAVNKLPSAERKNLTGQKLQELNEKLVKAFLDKQEVGKRLTIRQLDRNMTRRINSDAKVKRSSKIATAVDALISDGYPMERIAGNGKRTTFVKR